MGDEASVEEVACAIAADHLHLDGALLPVLHAVQAHYGFIPPGAVAAVAAELNLSRAEVHGVVSFYHDFRTEPPGRSILQICRAEACQAAGGDSLQVHARQRLGIDWGETTADGGVTLEAVYCLGNCACGPSVKLNDAVHALMDAPRLDALLESHLEEARKS